MATHPSCGLYRTTLALDQLPAGRLVYFHNHGEPGPGIYLPSTWNLNRAEWHTHGTTVPSAQWSSTLAPLAPEGLYVVREAFHCCDKKCTRFVEDQLVQLGYDGDAVPILFTPEWSDRGLGFPATGTRLDHDRVQKLMLLKVARGAASPKDTMTH